mgnify:CR=1 FL=1
MEGKISEEINELKDANELDAYELAEAIAMSIDEAQDIDGSSSSSEVIEVIETQLLDYLDYLDELYPEITEWKYLNDDEVLLNKIKKINLTKHAIERKKERDIDIKLNEENLSNSFLGYIDEKDTYRLVYDNITFILNNELTCIITIYQNKNSYYEWKNNDICRMEKDINKKIKKLEEKRKDLQQINIQNKIDEMIKLIQKDNTILTKLIESNYIPVNKKRNILETYINKLGGDITWKNIKKDNKKLNVNDTAISKIINNSTPKKKKKSKKKKVKQTQIIDNIINDEVPNPEKWTCKVCNKTICLNGKESHEKSKKHKNNLLKYYFN